MTIAETIATRYGNDGTQWNDDKEQHLSAVCEEAGGIKETKDTEDFRYVFPDDSVITVCGAGWDLGFKDCWCWAGCPSPECPNHK